VASINRLIREQNLPAKYFTPRKVFFEEGEVDTWLSRRNFGVAKSNATHAKALRVQRQKRNSPQASATQELKAEMDLTSFGRHR
jgi:hypothetical protein